MKSTKLKIHKQNKLNLNIVFYLYSRQTCLLLLKLGLLPLIYSIFYRISHCISAGISSLLFYFLLLLNLFHIWPDCNVNFFLAFYMSILSPLSLGNRSPMSMKLNDKPGCTDVRMISLKKKFSILSNLT